MGSLGPASSHPPHILFQPQNPCHLKAIGIVHTAESDYTDPGALQISRLFYGAGRHDVYSVGPGRKQVVNHYHRQTPGSSLKPAQSTGHAQLNGTGGQSLVNRGRPPQGNPFTIQAVGLPDFLLLCGGEKEVIVGLIFGSRPQLKLFRPGSWNGKAE